MHTNHPPALPSVQVRHDHRAIPVNHDKPVLEQEFSVVVAQEGSTNDIDNNRKFPSSGGGCETFDSSDKDSADEYHREDHEEVDTMLIQPDSVVYKTHCGKLMLSEDSGDLVESFQDVELFNKNEAEQIIAADPTALDSMAFIKGRDNKKVLKNFIENIRDNSGPRTNSDDVLSIRTSLAAPSGSEVARDMSGYSLERNGGNHFFDIKFDSDMSRGETGQHSDRLHDFDLAMMVELHQRASAKSNGSLANAGEKIKNIASHIVVQITQLEGGDLDVHMSPDELGLLRLSFSKGDRTTLVVYAERLDTLELLRRNSDLLQRELRESGLSAFDLDFRWSGTQSDQGSQHPVIFHNSICDEDQESLETSISPSITPIPRHRGGLPNLENIDIRF